MSTLRLFLCVMGCVGVLVASSCSAPPDTKACASDAVCDKGNICEAGTCVPGCRTLEDCPAEHFCQDKTCTKQVCKPGTQRECYDGPSETKNKGTCVPGEQLCLNDGESWSPCYSQQLPIPETCDSRDNDCDGTADEDLKCDCEPGEIRLCYTGGVQTFQVGLCRQGVQYCLDQRVWGECRDQSLPRAETCDGLDNDCNGEIDDNINCDCKPGAERECYSGKPGTPSVGRCRKGSQVCSPRGVWGACKNQVMPELEEFQRPEICNGKDDNCDGLVDNVSSDQSALKRLCYTGDASSLRKGPCKQGTQTCSNGSWGACEGEVTPKAEECNGKDDDCDGLVDNGIVQRSCVSAGSACKKTTSGAYQCLGQCQVGSQRCDNGAWTSCAGEVLPAAQESCGNGRDDDCNGLVDDKCVCKAGDARECYTGAAETKGRGVCTPGKQTCENNSWGACVGEGTAQSEICNGKDDNCDGTTDNLQGSCAVAGKQGRCAKGVWACVQGKKTCKANAVLTEVCNEEDDDCDGEIDNIADRGKACTDSTRYGVCADGRWQCVNKQKTCVATIKPGSTLEICNQMDDDCDGKVDNVQGACTVGGQQGQCAVGVWVCNKGVRECSQQNQSVTEVCNGKDDDCNGIVDDIADLNDPCQDKSRFGICRPGQWRCVALKKVCFQTTQAQASEICNKLDDNCDGQVDEGCTTCQSHRDCKSNEFCIGGNCVLGDCLTDADCKNGQVCRNLKCISCTQSSDCSSGKFCDNGVCKNYQCRVNSQCPRGLICDANFRCTGCSQSSQCGTGRTCLNGFCYGACNSNQD